MTNNDKELCFILALCAGFSLTETQAISAWNKGDIYIFSKRGIKNYYLDVCEDSWETLLHEDLDRNIVIKLDHNTFAMYM